MNYFIATILLLSISSASYAQNKKEQIVLLSQTIDSLNRTIQDQSGLIKVLQVKNGKSETQIDSLKTNISALQSQMGVLTKQLEMEQSKQKDNERKASVAQRSTDSLKQLVFELEHVKIGNQIWRNTNLKTTQFSNGDPIPEAKTPKEWVNYGKSNAPCFAKLPNNEYLYNGFVLRDARGIAPNGYAVPSSTDFETLFRFILNGRKKWSTVQEILLDYEWYIETFDAENGGGIKDSTGIGKNSLAFTIKKAGFISPTGNLNGYALPSSNDFSEDGEIDFNPNDRYTSAVPFGSCSYFWTSTQSNSNDIMRRYEVDQKWAGKPLNNCIDFGFCSQDEGGAIQDDQIQSVEYAPYYGFSIRLIKK